MILQRLRHQAVHRIAPALPSLLWPTSLYLSLWIFFLPAGENPSFPTPGGEAALSGATAEWIRLIAKGFILCAAAAMLLRDQGLCVRPRARAPFPAAAATLLLAWSAYAQNREFNFVDAATVIGIYWAAHWETCGHRLRALFSRDPEGMNAQGDHQETLRKLEAVKRFFAWHFSSNEGAAPNLVKNVFIEFEGEPVCETELRVPPVRR